MRKETFFRLSRMALLFIVFVSAIIPFIYLPQPIHPIVSIKLDPIFQRNIIIEEPVQMNEIPVAIHSSVPASDTIQPIVFSTKTIVLFVYLAGVFISLLLFVYSIISVLLLFRKSRKTDLNGICLMILNGEIPGHQKFALANSFNYCQIKKRITMMNKSKTNKAWCWKVATFLPLLALLLMAFGKMGENVPEKSNVPEKVIASSGIIQKQNEQFRQKIEIKKDGNYIDNKLCSLEELVKKGQEWGKAGNDWILLMIDESIPFKRIDEVREALANAKVYFVTQSIAGSDDIVYFMEDVSESAKFTQGKFDDWMKSQLNKYSEAKSKAREYKILYSFIIDKNGKVRDGHVIKGCDYPEINAAYEKILTQIPDWEPEMRLGVKVSVYYHLQSSYASIGEAHV